MTINQWASSTEAYLLLATVISFAIALFYSIMCFCDFFGRLTKGIILGQFDIRWKEAIIKITILWTIFFILHFFLTK